jgi:hypothetical protein
LFSDSALKNTAHNQVIHNLNINLNLFYVFIILNYFSPPTAINGYQRLSTAVNGCQRLLAVREEYPT